MFDTAFLQNVPQPPYLHLSDDDGHHMLEENISLLFLLIQCLIVLIDDGNRQQDTSSRANGTEHVREDGKSTNTHTSESSCGRDIHV
mmetsp:Transcript_21688/g.18476  ORF Transcript_21688/g.18476 Transcript_21688/m.18476 type:complete len:87 (-) Transcript_21688:266-526(-)